MKIFWKSLWSTIICTYNKVKDKCEVLGNYLGVKAWILEFFAKHLKSQCLQEKKHTIISNYLKNECWNENRLNTILNGVTAHCQEKANKQVIWVFWYQGYDSMPEMVKKCYNQLNRMKGQSEVILLSRDNLNEYITLPQFVYDRLNSGEITITHFSDIIRFALLYLYGGFWVDATVWLTKPFPKWLLDSRYWTVRNPQPKYTISVSRYKWASFLLYVNKAGDDFPKIVLALMLLYVEKHNHFVDYLLLDYCMELATKQNAVRIDWNKINNSNTHLYELIKHINNTFDYNEWSRWGKDTFVYKLSYKVIIEHKNNSYYNKIVLS